MRYLVREWRSEESSYLVVTTEVLLGCACELQRHAKPQQTTAVARQQNLKDPKVLDGKLRKLYGSKELGSSTGHLM